MSPARRGELSARVSEALGYEVDVADLRTTQGEFLAQVLLGGEIVVKRDSSLLGERALKFFAYRDDMRSMAQVWCPSRLSEESL